MAIHARGPWKVRTEDGPPYTDILGPNGSLMATVYPDLDSSGRAWRPESIPEAEANARLIASLPDILSDICDTKDQVGLLTAERGRLKAALEIAKADFRDYGRHAKDCYAYEDRAHDCDCGFADTWRRNEALSPATPTDNKES